MKKMRTIIALALSALVLAGSIAVPVAASDKSITRVGRLARTVYVGKEIDLEVREGRNVRDRHLKWAIRDTSVATFEENDSYGDEVELVGKNAGMTLATCENTTTGEKINYIVVVKAVPTTKAVETVETNTKTVETKTRTVEVDDDFELRTVKAANIKANQIEWKIADTNILRFDEGDKYGTEVELEARKVGTTEVTCTNLVTKETITYTITVVPDIDD